MCGRLIGCLCADVSVRVFFSVCLCGYPFLAVYLFLGLLFCPLLCMHLAYCTYTCPGWRIAAENCTLLESVGYITEHMKK